MNLGYKKKFLILKPIIHWFIVGLVILTLRQSFYIGNISRVNTTG